MCSYKHIHTCVHTPWGHIRDIWLSLSEFSFISCDLLTPGSHRRQTGISITSCPRCNAAIGCLTDDVWICANERKLMIVELFLTFGLFWKSGCYSACLHTQTSKLLICICLLKLSSSLFLSLNASLSLFLFYLLYHWGLIFQCLKLQGISYANIDVQLCPASYQLKSANRWA